MLQKLQMRRAFCDSFEDNERYGGWIGSGDGGSAQFETSTAVTKSGSRSMRAYRPANTGDWATMFAPIPVTHCEFDLYLVDTLGTGREQELETAIFAMDVPGQGSYESLLCMAERQGFYAGAYYGGPTGERSPLFALQPMRNQWLHVEMTTMFTGTAATSGVLAITPNQGVKETRTMEYSPGLMMPRITFGLVVYDKLQSQVDMHFDNVRCR
jgi:hypothetical protein